MRSAKCTLAPELAKSPVIGRQIKLAYYRRSDQKALYMARLIKQTDI